MRRTSWRRKIKNALAIKKIAWIPAVKYMHMSDLLIIIKKPYVLS